MNESAKRQLAQTGIFTGVVLFFFLLLALFSTLGKKNWEKGLRAAVEQVLPQDEYQCGELVPIESSFSVSAACFELLKKSEPSKKYRALVLRISSYWGPLPAVFVCGEGKTEFMGAAYMKSSVSRALEEEKDDRQMLYWKKIAGEIAWGAAAGSGKEAKK